MSLQTICESIYSDVNGAIAVAVVDLSSGMPLQVYHRVSYFTQDYVDLVSAASVDMFRGRNVAKVEEKLADQRNRPLSHAIQEVLMTTEGTIHFMAVLPEKKDILALLVTNKKVSIGMGWAVLRNALPEISSLV